MTLLSDTPPGAVAGPAAKPEVPHVGIEFPYPAMAQRAEREKVGKPADVKLNLPAGVVDSTLSERGAALAAIQAQAQARVLAAESSRTIGDALPEQKPIATPAPALRTLVADEKTEPTAAEKLVAAAAKSLGLDAGEAKAVAELPPASVVIVHPEPTLAAELKVPADVQPGTKLIHGEVGKVDADIKIVETPAAAPVKPGRRAPMQMVQRLRLMELVRAAPADEPDCELAARVSLQLDRAIGSGTVKDYRLQLGLKSVPMPSKAELRAKLAALQAELAAKEQPTLPGVPSEAGI